MGRKVDERLLVLRSYFQRAPNPVRGFYGGALSWHCFPTGGLEAGEACGVVGDSPSSVHWAQTLINHLFRGYRATVRTYATNSSTLKRKWHLIHCGIAGNSADL